MSNRKRLFRPRRSMTQVYLLSMLLLTTIPIVILGGLWISQQFDQSDALIARYQQSQLQTRRQYLKDQVAQYIDTINQRREQAREQLRADLKARTEGAYRQIDTLYRSDPPGNAKARQGLRQRAAELLRPIRFHGAGGWHVLIDGRGTLVLNPAMPGLEGQPVSQRPGAGGDDEGAQIIALARRRGEDFVEFDVERYDDPQQTARRISYFKYHEPLDLVIFSGAYLEDMEAALKRQLIGIERRAEHNTAYAIPVILDRDGTVLSHAGAPQLEGVNGYAVTDASRDEALFAAHRRAAEDPDGGFVEYSWQPPSRSQPGRKVSFVQRYPDWGWLIASEYSRDAMQQLFADYRASMRDQVLRDVALVAGILCAVLLAAVALASWFARHTASGFSRFNRFFDAASGNASQIDSERLPYTEFAELAERANRMIAERARYEQALRASEQQFQLALHHSRHYVWDVDIEARSLTLSPGFFEELGYRGVEGFDLDNLDTIFSLCHPDDLQILKAPSVTARLQQDGVELRLKDNSGHYRWFFTRGSPIDPGAPHQRMLGIVTEITARKRMEEELVAARIAAEDANYSKSQFLSTMSHELRTPLNGVLGYAQLLLRDRQLSAEQRQHIETIADCGERLLAMIGDILQLSKIESESVDIQYQDCWLPSLCQQVSDIAAPRARDKGLEYNWHIDPAVPPHIAADTVKLKQILVNLLANAIKFTPSGWVTLSVDYDARAQQVLFAVADSGPGIATEQLQQVFEPFRQLDADEASGAGLGLTVSRRLAEAMGGRLTAVSEPGQGSRFCLHLPVTRQLDADSEPAMPASTAAVPVDAGEAPEKDTQLHKLPLQRLQRLLRLGDVEALTLELDTLLTAEEEPGRREWLHRCRERVRQFDLGAVERMIEDAMGSETVN